MSSPDIEPAVAPAVVPAPVAPAVVAPVAPAPWYAARNDAEFTGTVQNMGLDKKDVSEAAFEFYKSHREAQKLISKVTGTPDKDRILIRPKADAPEAEIAAWHEKLGRPAKADDYDYKDVKSPTGTELDAEQVAQLRASAFKANLTKEQAASIAKDQVEFAHKIAEAKAVVDQAKLAEEIRAVEKNWGPNHDANLFIAKQAMAKFGFTPDMLQTMQKTLGAGKIMDGFLKLGIQTGEARFIANQTQGGPQIMTREQAKARFAELKQDRAWGDKLRKGDVATVAEFNALSEMMVTEQRLAA